LAGQQAQTLSKWIWRAISAWRIAGGQAPGPVGFGFHWNWPRKVFYTAHSDGNPMDANSTVKLISGLLAVLLIAIVFLRRKKKKGAAEDEF